MKNHIISLSAISIIIFSLLTGCVETPTNTHHNSTTGTRAAYVLCEGIYGSDGANLTRYDMNSGLVIEDYFSYVNTKLHLGDVGNNMVIYGNYAYIAVSMSKTIEAIDMETGESTGRIIFTGERQPRKIVIVNDSVGYVTDLKQNSVIKFDTKKMVVLNEIKVGPAPEGIAYFKGQLFVANSGYGDLGANKPDAGTVYVLDEATLQLVKKLSPGPNVCDVIVNEKNNKLYAKYHHLYTKPDSLGGIVEYDLSSFEAVRTWRDKISSTATSMDFTLFGDSLFYVNSTGVAMIDLNTGINNKWYLTNSTSGENWYSLSVSPFDGSLWIGNARNYAFAGQVLVYNLYAVPTLKTKFTSGIIPNTIVFYE